MLWACYLGRISYKSRAIYILCMNARFVIHANARSSFLGLFAEKGKSSGLRSE